MRALDQATLRLQAARQAYADDRGTFGNWLATRKATSLPSQDAELTSSRFVPDLPSHGGCVHRGVGLIVTVPVGRTCVTALNRHLARQTPIEQQPEVVRCDEPNCDTALVRLAGGICPGRAARKSAFAPFCHARGPRAAARLR